MHRRAFLSGGLAFGALSCTHSTNWTRPFSLDEVTISALAEGLASGNYTAEGLAVRYLERIEAIDRRGPALRSVIELNPDTLSIAAALDRERRDKGARGPLHGIPILVKDNIDTGDRMLTSAGSLALMDDRPTHDAPVVARLRQAGAVILGKTNLSEWANIRSSHSTSGWSGRGGLTRNPYALDRNPSGSSSGSGAAVAANLCAAAVGTETDGSVVSPSSFCGIVGIKPTIGLIPQSGIIPISHTQDTAGPMARTVADAAILLGAMQDTPTDYRSFLKKDGLKGARLGVARQMAGFSDAVDRVLATCIDVLKKSGAEVIDPIEIPSHGKMGDAELTVLLYELKADMAAYLAKRPSAKVRSLADIIEFNQRHRSRELRYFGQDLFEKAEKLGPLTDKAYLDALAQCRLMSREQGIDAAMGKHQLDAIIAPTSGPAHKTDLAIGDYGPGGSSTYPAVAGYPHITVPAGFIRDLPFGLSFFGRPRTEAKLIQFAYAYEQANPVRRKPGFLPPQFG